MRSAILATALAVTLAASDAIFANGPIHVGAAQTNVDVGNFYFCDPSFQGAVCEKTINAGDTVVWSVTASFHTVTECDVNYATCPPAGGFDSATLSQGQQFQRTFSSAGTFYYECVFHGQAMRGRLVVQAAQATPTPSPTPSPTASPTAARTAAASATPTRTPAAVPATGGYPSDGGGAGTAAGLAFLAGGLAALAGAAVVSRSIARRRA